MRAGRPPHYYRLGLRSLLSPQGAGGDGEAAVAKFLENSEVAANDCGVSSDSAFRKGKHGEVFTHLAFALQKFAHPFAHAAEE